MTCTAASHDALKRTWADFETGTRIGFSWQGLIVRHCVDCCSSLTMPECARCSCGCPVDDCVTTKNARGDEVAYHARCILDAHGRKEANHVQRAPMMRSSKTLAERFWAKVDKTGDCWIWTASRNTWGYGKIGGAREAGVRAAHRVSWELANGPITGGLWVLHRCDNPPCVNPAHLFLGDAADNAADMDDKGRRSPIGVPGSANGRAKLSPATVARVRRVRAAGATYSTLAEKFGICPAHARRICLQIAWRTA